MICGSRNPEKTLLAHIHSTLLPSQYGGTSSPIPVHLFSEYHSWPFFNTEKIFFIHYSTFISYAINTFLMETFASSRENNSFLRFFKGLNRSKISRLSIAMKISAKILYR